MKDDLESIVSRPGKFGVSFLMRPSPFIKFPFDIAMKDRENRPTIVRVEECVQDVGGSRVPTGLRVRTVIEGNDMGDSWECAGNLSEKIAHVCSLVANVGTPIVSPETIYQAGKTSRRFSIFFVDLPLPPMPRRVIDAQVALDALQRIESTWDKDQIDRIVRTLDWYRKAITTGNTYNQLLWLWFGFESLDRILTKSLDLKRGKDAGIKHELRRLVAGWQDMYNTAKRLRDSIAHPIEGKMPKASDCIAITPKLACALRTSLAEAIGIDVEDARFYPTLQSDNPMRMNVQGWIHDSEGALDFMSREAPRLEFKGFRADVSLGRDEPTEVRSEVNVTYKGPRGTSYERTGIGATNLQYGSLIRPTNSV